MRTLFLILCLSMIVCVSLAAQPDTLTIFNVLGQRVETLVQGYTQAAPHAVTWHANVTSGAYFYQLDVMDEHGAVRFRQTRRMILMR